MFSHGHVLRAVPQSVLESAPPPFVAPPQPWHPESYPPLHNDASSLSPSATTPQYANYAPLGATYQPNILAMWNPGVYEVTHRSYVGGS
jgi:hypothetical protein